MQLPSTLLVTYYLPIPLTIMCDRAGSRTGLNNALVLRRFRQQVVVLSCGFILEKVLVLSIY